MSDARDRVRALLLPVAAAAGAAVSMGALNRHYPVREWLALRVAGYWALALVWGLGCLGVGVRALALLAPRRHRISEVPFIGFALGVLLFGVVVFVVGVLGGLGRAFLVGAPLVFLAAGAPALAELFRRRREIDPFRGAAPGWLTWAALALGGAGLLCVYLPLLSPHNLQHDARWYHLPIAQQYASMGAIRPFREGWLLGAYPHLASLLYTWPMLLPVGIVHRLEVCAHLELVIFLVTIAATPAVVRRLLPGARVPAAWAGFFLFPGFLVYDSNLSTGADHVAALFAPAGLLALLPALRSLDARRAALVGVIAGGAALTKYSALSVAIPLVAFLLASAALRAVRSRELRRAGVAAGACIAAFVVTWSPHWLKNLLWHGDPLYPNLHAYLHAHPWDARATFYLKVFVRNAILRPTADLAGALESLRAALTLGFEVHEYGFHGDVPTFGFLFAATLYCLPFSRAGRRIWTVYGLGVCGALVWYWTNHRDRYLQAFLPWLVAGTVAALATMARDQRLGARIAARVLVAGQLVAGAGVFLIQSYIMVPDGHPLPHVMRLVQAGYEGRFDERFEPYGDWDFAAWVDVGRHLPAGARVLAHEERLWLGLDHPVVVDEAQWQAGIRYSGLTHGQIHDLLRSHGVTHVVVGKNAGDGGDHGIAANLGFYDFLHSHATRVHTSRKLSLWELPAERPPDAPDAAVLILTCNQSQPAGLYAIGDILRREPEVPIETGEPLSPELLSRAQFLVVEDGCGIDVDAEALRDFHLMHRRLTVDYYKRVPSN